MAALMSATSVAQVKVSHSSVVIMRFFYWFLPAKVRNKIKNEE